MEQQTPTSPVSSLWGDDVDPPVAGRPDPDLVELEGCEVCAERDCRPMARLSWPVHYDSGVVTDTEIVGVGRACIAAACDVARETLIEGGRIALDMPSWSVTEACAEARVSRDRFQGWAEQGLFPVERDTVNRRRAVVSVHADGIHRLRRLGALVALFERPAKVRDFLVAHPDIADGLLAEVAPSAVPA